MTQTRARVDPIEVLSPSVVSVTARWKVSASALVRAVPGVIAPGGPGHHAVLEILLEHSPSGWACSAVLIERSMASPHRLETDPGPVSVLRDQGLVHVGAPGLLFATFREGDRGAGIDDAALFVRTPVFEALGVAGGRYELESASIA